MDADRSNVEIKVLLRNLDTAKASVKHKDRLRRLNKFRNYVTARPPPEFYDDDHSLLLLGSDSPTAMEDEALSGMVLVGLLSASGCPSTDHKEALKRSARPAISLLRYLCLEFDGAGGITGEPNGFACALCALDVARLRTMRLELHIGRGDGDGGGTRGGSKDDACALLALVLARHTDPDGGSPDPVSASDLLPEPRVRAEFERWLGENAGQDARRAIRENAEAAARPGGPAKAAAGGEDDGDEHDEDDVLGVFGIGKRGGPSDSSKPGGGGPARPGQKPHAQQTPAAPAGPPTAWSQTSMAEKRERASGAIFLEEEQKKDAEAQARAKEEKQRLLQRDPLGILGPGTFDLQAADAASEHLLRQTLREVEAEIEQELQLAGDSGVEKVNWLEAQRQAILAVSERRSLPSGSNISCSPTSPAFDPMLFLTLAHRTATYEELRESTSRLSRKTDSQVERLQNLVRENFPLFIKCSEGIDVFAEAGAGRADADGASADDGGRGERQRNLEGRFASLDALALSCADQARRSFKPLLDNTNEVRKVQSALSVLQRVAPLLQVPSLMRQHIENGNFSSAVKCYRKVLVIDRDNCDVDLLRHVRVKAGEAAQDARNDLELILADQESSADGLLDALRDLGELLELLEEEGENGDDAAGGGGGGGPADAMATPRSSGQGVMRPGTFSIDRHVICVRDYPPALACLLLQTSHFRSLVEKAVSGTEAAADRVFRGEGPDGGGAQSTGGGSGSGYSSSDGASGGEGSSSQRTRDKRWKFEVLEVRTDATLRAVGLAKNWLPRLIQIGLATQEAEKRALARNRRGGGGAAGGGAEDPDRARDTKRGKGKSLSAHSVFSSIVSPALTRLVEHVAFCSLGCANQGSRYKITSTFGRGSADRLRSILKSPLPATQTAKCALDLAELAEAIQEANEAMASIRPPGKEDSKDEYKSPLERASDLTNDAVVMIERRVCIYSFDSCARKCSISASGSGLFDGDALLQCVQKLSDDITRSDECSREIERGCLLVCQKCCDGLTSYVKDRSDAARLRVVAECADALNTTLVDVVREVSYLTNDQSDALEASLSSVISTLEQEMFDVFLESVKRNVASCSRLGPTEAPPEDGGRKGREEVTTFPPYLAASFLAIVRCRAQVERALRDLKRSDEGTTYQFMALQTASDGVVENICIDLKAKSGRIRHDADVYSIHLQFLIGALKKYLSDEVLSLASDTRRMLLSASSGSRGKGMGNGPEGLTALENLERLGRVYMICLGE